MNQQVVLPQQVVAQEQPQERIQALMVQAQWFSSVMIGLAVAGGVLILVPKIVGAVKEEK
ncbi:unnamed protein product [marine sediment metagenome]|uniref:Uncharacterized protein n=1 Tax=marine sediment metagenome TaxID=412755 RepID=X1UF46_9ZZZZ